MRQLLYLILPFWLLVLLSQAAPAQNAGEGRSFVLTLPYTAVANSYVPPRARLVLTSRAGATVQLLYTATGATETVVVGAGSSEEVQIDSARVMLPQSIGQFRATVQITADAPVAASIMLDRPFAAEAYGAIPDTLLGFSHVVMTHGAGEQGDVLAVIGIHNDTRVAIIPSYVLSDGRPAGVPINITLNRGDVYQILTSPGIGTELTNTVITSSSPCGVVGGSVCADVVAGAEHSCNPLLEQYPHADSWGTQWAIGPLERQPTGIARVIARCIGTEVRVNGSLISTLGKGGAVEFTVDTAYDVQTSGPAMLVQLVTSTSRGLPDRAIPYGDPSMVVVPPASQWARTYRVGIPSMAARTDAGPPVGWRHFLQVAMAVAAEPGVRIDGVAPTWIRRMRYGGVVVGVQEIGPGDHTVEAADSVGLFAYGYSAADAYGYVPAPVTHRFQLVANALLATTCRDTLDTTVTIRNPGPDIVSVAGIDFGGLLDGSLRTPITFPFDLAPGASRTVDVRLKRIGAGRTTGYIFARGAGCTTILAAIGVRLGSNAPVFAPAVGTLVDYGVLPQALSFADRVITIHNNGATPITLVAPTAGTAEFLAIAPAFPHVLAPGDSVQVTVRFTPSRLGRFTDTLSFGIAECPDRWRYPVVGEQKQRAYITVGRPAALHLLCNPKLPDTLYITIANEGDVAFNIIRGQLDGANIAEFTLLDSIAGRTIAPGDSIIVRVLYQPSGLGARDAGLTVESSAGNGSSIYVPFDVRNDLLWIQPLSDTLDLGTTLSCQPPPSARVGFINRSTIGLGGARVRLIDSALGTVNMVSRSYPPGDTIWVDLAIDAATAGPFSDMVRVSVPECSYSANVILRGERATVALEAEADTLDFGVLGACDTALTRVFILHNIGAVIDTLAMTSLPGSAFMVVDTQPGLLVPGGSRAVSCQFVPTTPGVFLDSVIVASEPCGIRRRIILRGVYDANMPALSSGAASFGAVTVGTFARRSVWVVNRSLVPYRIAGLVPGGPWLQVLRPAAGTVIAPGDSVELELEYRPGVPNDTITGPAGVILDSPCPDTLLLNIDGHSERERALLTLRWEAADAWVNIDPGLRLVIDQGASPILDDSLLVRATLRYNRTVLYPTAIEPSAPGLAAGIVSGPLGSGELGELTVEVRGVMPAAGTIATLNSRVMLGNADSSFLLFGPAVAQRAATGAPIAIADTVGDTLHVLGICRTGGDRLLSVNNLLRIVGTVPYPVDAVAEVAFRTTERGHAELVLYNAASQRALVLVDADLEPGDHSVLMNASALPSGPYLLVLRSGLGIAGQVIVVAH